MTTTTTHNMKKFSAAMNARTALLALIASIAAVDVSLASTTVEMDAYTVPVPVNYTDPYDGVALTGYLALPPSATSDTPAPAVLIFPDWSGVDDYEIARAAMIAEQWGYVAFAADVYGYLEGGQRNPEDTDDRINMSGMYRNNVTWSNARIKAAVELVLGMEEVDEELGVAILGYCFGGSIVLNHALSGQYDNVRTCIAYHGSISAVEKDYFFPIVPKVVIYSGGEDTFDSTESVVEMEDALNAGNATWELNRYSFVQHGFTAFTSEAYDPYVDDRTWESTGRILMETFRQIELVADVPDNVTGEDVSYVDPGDGTELLGFLSIPAVPPALEGPNGNLSSLNAASPDDHKVPAVIIIHDANGIDDYERTRAQMLSDLGYVGFAADIYGVDNGVNMTDRDALFAMLDSYRDDVPLFVQRIKAAVTHIASHPHVDPAKIALIGYCFGGTGVMNYAVTGQSDVVAIVSFHGGLSKLAPVGESPIIVRMNVQSGGDDDTSSEIEDLEFAMESGNATWEYARYSDVLHSFTNWFDEQGRYNPRADVRSWESMKGFLEKAFGEVDAENGEMGANMTESGGDGEDESMTSGNMDGPMTSGNTEDAMNGGGRTFETSMRKIMGAGLTSAATFLFSSMLV